MGAHEGYLIIGKKKGIKHYFLPSINAWTADFGRISLKDINEEKQEIDMSEYPEMDPEYTHSKITINGNFIE